MADVRLSHIHKVYVPDVLALDDISLQIPDGELLVLVGPSGCGKSTLLRIIAGLEEATRGEIVIGGRAVEHLAPKDRDVAMVFQNYALYPHMTVFENMAFGLRLRRVPRTEIAGRVAAAADLLGIGDLLQRRPKQLSGGQAQRVAVGRAIVRQPAVFLLDEPLSNLDAQQRADTRRELRRLHDRLNSTMLLVTHDQAEAMTLGDRLVVLRRGVVQQVGTPREIYESPRNRFVAGFVGSPAMNFLPGRWEHSEPAPVFRPAGSEMAWPITFELQRVPASRGEVATLGLRPESISLDGAAASASCVRWTGCITEVQYVGGESVLRVAGEGVELTARVMGHRSWGRGEQVRLCLNIDQAHLFDTADQNLKTST